jgi:hypothetical protein
MPPTTSLSDCLWIIALSVGIAATRYLAGLTGFFCSAEAKGFAGWLLRRKAPLVIDPTEAETAVHKYYRSPAAFFIIWFPWLAFCSGNIVVSLLRDAGFMIFPWPILINCALLGVWLPVSAVLKFRGLSRFTSAA